MDRTLVLLKPDAVQRALVGELIARFERKGLKLAALKLFKMTREKAEQFYSIHRGKRFYEGLVDYIISGPIVALVLDGQDVIPVVRAMMGTTDPKVASPGTIRGDHGLFIGRNVVHGSDSAASAEKEIPIVFDASELIDYERIDERWLYEHE